MSATVLHGILGNQKRWLGSRQKISSEIRTVRREVEKILEFIANSTDINYRVSPAVGLYGGYHYSTRQIRSIENFSFPEFPGPPQGVTAEQDNHIHSGAAGLRLKPIKPLTLSLDGEVSRADRPFTPISDRNFHALRGRVQYKAKTLLLSAAYRQNYNTNSVTLSTHSARARNYSFDASWAPRAWLAFDAGYSRLHLNTVSGIAFFANSEQIKGLHSIYISNLHAANSGARLCISAIRSPRIPGTAALRRRLLGPLIRLCYC